MKMNCRFENEFLNVHVSQPQLPESLIERTRSLEDWNLTLQYWLVLNKLCNCNCVTVAEILKNNRSAVQKSMILLLNVFNKAVARFFAYFFSGSKFIMMKPNMDRTKPAFIPEWLKSS